MENIHFNVREKAELLNDIYPNKATNTELAQLIDSFTFARLAKLAKIIKIFSKGKTQ